jgi:serine/threonine protein kinase
MGANPDSKPPATLLAQQRLQWSRGERVPVEHYIERHPDLRTDTELLLDLIYSEVVLRREAGEEPTAGEYTKRFPALADAILIQFEVDAVVDSAITLSGDQPAGRGQTSAAPPKPPPGYELLAELGHGGMGVVYKARHLALDRLVALKMIRSGELADPVERERFEAEARAVARLSHPNIIQIYEVGEVEGRPFLALEYVPGQSLAEALRGPPFAAWPAATLVATLARAIQHAHEAGIVHRDLKPANILLGGEFGERNSEAKTKLDQKSDDTPRVGPSGHRTIKITDFGLAKHLDSEGLTRTGDFLGTPNFAAPEQAAGRPDVGPTADVYSLGAILYNLVTGRPPFTGTTALETLDQVRFAEPVPPSRLQPNLPRDLETIILACLRKDPARRYPAAAALAEDLDRFLNGQSIRARPVGNVERGLKWARRRPAVAGLLAAIVVLGTATLITTTVLWQRAAASRDAEARARADEQARSAELLIANARYAWLTDDLDAARTALSACPPEHRNADWAYLDRATSAVRLTIAVPNTMVTNLAYDPSGRYLAGVSFSGHIGVWDAASGERLAWTKVCEQGLDHAHSIAFVSDDRVAVALRSTRIQAGKPRASAELKFLNWRTGKLAGGWQRSEDAALLMLSPDGRRVAFIAAGSADVWLVDLETGENRQRLNVSTSAQIGATFSVDGKLVATRANTTDVRVWDAETATQIRRLKVTNELPVTGLFAVSADGLRFVAGIQRSDHPAQLLLLDPDRELLRLQTPFAFVVGVALSPDGRFITAFGRERMGLPIWRADNGQEEIVLRGHRAALRHLVFRPDSRELAASFQDGKIVVWKIEP